jgi:hypothetical protein
VWTATVAAGLTGTLNAGTGNFGLTINGRDANALNQQFTAFGTTAYNNLIFQLSGGTNAAPNTAIPSGATLTQFSIRGNDGTGYFNSSYLYWVSAEAWTATAHGTSLNFSTTPAGGTTMVTNQLNHNGGLMLPSNVTGGSLGAGSINVSNGYFRAGVNVITGKAVLASVFPANPTGTTSITSPGVMMGLGTVLTITPNLTGRIVFTICGQFNNSAAAAGSVASLRYGTGAAPANGVAAAGTVVAQTFGGTVPTANGAVTITLSGLASGLTVGTAYWFDLAVFGSAAGTITANSLTGSAYEV